MPAEQVTIPGALAAAEREILSQLARHSNWPAGAAL
jgi:hypothetical protein